MKNEIINLIEIVKNTQIKKIEVKQIMTLERYMDATRDKKLNTSLFEFFGYDDEEIFELDYNFLIKNIY
jgi:hypothetical protein